MAAFFEKRVFISSEETHSQFTKSIDSKQLLQSEKKMNLMTKKMIDYAWKHLPKDHGFFDFEQFFETARELGEFDMDANPHFYCPKNRSNPVLSAGNLKLVRVHTVEDLEDVYEPSVEITLERLS